MKALVVGVALGLTIMGATARAQESIPCSVEMSYKHLGGDLAPSPQSIGALEAEIMRTCAVDKMDAIQTVVATLSVLKKHEIMQAFACGVVFENRDKMGPPKSCQPYFDFISAEAEKDR